MHVTVSYFVKKPLLLFPLAFLLAAAACGPRGAPDSQLARWEAQARAVTILRDDWGIPHIYGKTDADVVFGLMYAKAEDDFNRIEVNFLNSQGRLAEAEGEREIWRDLRMRLFIDPDEMKALYQESPGWLKKLMDAWADGLNHFLYKNPQVRPRVLTHFEPWMALTFSEGSIGGDIESLSLAQLEAFYGGRPENAPGSGLEAARGTAPGNALAVATAAVAEGEPTGSNGIAIAPSNTASGNALLLINPHTSFYFRAEAKMASEEGLNAYGALTWGQFFIYQGFNDRVGWMHTSSSADNIDEYLETIVERDGAFYYRYGQEERPVQARRVTVRFKTEGGMGERDFTIYRTHHGPIVREADGKWVSVALMEEPLKALTQSYSRTKARSWEEFRRTMELHTNSSNNTIYADADGNIAYFHANFVPVRDTRFDFSRPVDGSDPATDWQGVHTMEEVPLVLNPPNGWIQNTNNWPYSVAGAHSPRKEDFPPYVDRGSENPRGVHAIRVLEGRTGFTLGSLLEAAYDPWLPAFEDLLPGLLAAYDALPAADPLRGKLAGPAEELRGWDRRWGVESVATSLAVLWGEEIWGRASAGARQAGLSLYDYVATRAPARQLLEALEAVCARLEEEFGSWSTPWGEINRFQRLTGDIVHRFDDDAPSLPVGFTSGRWGSLASFGARRFQDSRRLYGTSGNSFVAVVEFGDSVRARAIMAGGQSGDPASPHFSDQALRYSTGDLREVYFYRSQLEGRVRREYHPGG